MGAGEASSAKILSRVRFAPSLVIYRRILFLPSFFSVL